MSKEVVVETLGTEDGSELHARPDNAEVNVDILEES